MLTLALTGVVPLTEEPEPGDVMVTIRLPPGSGRGGSNCARAWGAAKPTNTNRAAAFASLTRNAWMLLTIASPCFLRDEHKSGWILDVSRDDIKGVYQDPGIRRNRAFAYHLDRQRMSPRRQAVFEEVGALRSFRLGVRIEGILHDDSIQGYAGDPALGSAGADPPDSRPGEGDRRLGAYRIGFRAGPLAVRLVPIVLNPTVAVGDGRIRILVARSRQGHFERIHHDKWRHGGRVLLACHFDRQRMGPVGEALLREYLRLDMLRG